MHHSLFIEFRSNVAAANKNLLLLKVITRLFKKILFFKKKEREREGGLEKEQGACGLISSQ